MEKVNSISFFVAKAKDGSWAAATNQSPYFFFTGESEEDVVQKANRALDFFYEQSGEVVEVKKERPKTLSTFYPKRRITRDDCVAA